MDNDSKGVESLRHTASKIRNGSIQAKDTSEKLEIASAGVKQLSNTMEGAVTALQEYASVQEEIASDLEVSASDLENLGKFMTNIRIRTRYNGRPETIPDLSLAASLGCRFDGGKDVAWYDVYIPAVGKVSDAVSPDGSAADVVLEDGRVVLCHLPDEFATPEGD